MRNMHSRVIHGDLVQLTLTIAELKVLMSGEIKINWEGAETHE